MGDVIEKLTFDKLLRNALPGGICIATALLVYPELREFGSTEKGVFDVTVVFALSLCFNRYIADCCTHFLFGWYTCVLERRRNRPRVQGKIVAV